jgi:hypothetical protein
MTIREQLNKELEQVPDAMVEEVLDFCLRLKQSQQAQESNQINTASTSGILDLLERIKEIQSEVPAAEWDKLTHDGSINHDHYLYGAPTIEQM